MMRTGRAPAGPLMLRVSALGRRATGGRRPPPGAMVRSTDRGISVRAGPSRLARRSFSLRASVSESTASGRNRSAPKSGIELIPHSLSWMEEYLVHHSPILAFGPALERRLAWIGQFPPLLSRWIGGHLASVGGEILAMVLPISEKQVLRLAQED